ncbi:MAG: hypothetical protein QM690_12210 [Sphingobium sp.]
MLLAVMPPRAMAQQGEAADRPHWSDDRTLLRAGEIMAQPARDVGLARREIAPVLLTAQASPYALPYDPWCGTIAAELAALDGALGPDYGASRAERRNRLGAAAEMGGEMVVNGLIPFRGIVREVSGAAAADRRLAAAVTAGIARRGFLHGLAQGHGCEAPRLAYALVD